MINEKTAKELAKTMREINANAKKNKKITRPVVDKILNDINPTK